MIMITGGAYQGKTAYIKKQFNAHIYNGSDCTFDEAKSSKVLKNYHVLVRRLINSGIDADEYTRTFCTVNPESIVLIDEIGSGIIPMDKSERIWRETVGRCGCILASYSDSVIRIVCGIPKAIKGKLL